MTLFTITSLMLMIVLTCKPRQNATALNENHRGHQLAPSVDSGLTHCGEYSNQILANGKCRIIATLPQQDGNRCPDMFRCADEVSYWLHENEERKQDILELRELISELQEELRNHRHRLKVLEQQPEEENYNSTVEQRVHSLENWASESSTLQQMQTTCIYAIQAQIHNLSLLMDFANRNSSCLVPDELRSQKGQRRADVRHTSTRPIDCSKMYYNGIQRSRVYTIMPAIGGIPTDVLCEMDIEGGGWTVIQRRHDGSVNFNRSWKEYKEGFGNLNSEFWLGNENIYRITSQGDYSLLIDLEDWNNNRKQAFYRSFSIEDETNHYRLHVEGFSGTAEDSFAWYHNKKVFSTPDSDNICAEIAHGGWWYHQCFYSNLNGVYYMGGRYLKGPRILGPDGIVWYSWRNTDYYSLKKVSMMIRPRTFHPHQSP
ncbi:fibrinogen-like protein 1 [Ascaphus truei]|uniref:fibrinogen-like protein 1 n=1 Tax=Ascaphus truei TaxID=8439 RepID=UPI003F59D8C6